LGLSLGSWLERGGSGAVHLTPLTLLPEGQRLIQRNMELFKQVSNVARIADPEYAKEMMKVPPCWRLLDLFCLLICNLTSGLNNHRDEKDYKWCFVFLLPGEFDGGELMFPFLNTTISSKMGDLLRFESSKLWHQVQPYFGDRKTVVLTTHRAVINRS